MRSEADFVEVKLIISKCFTLLGLGGFDAGFLQGETRRSEDRHQ